MNGDRLVVAAVALTALFAFGISAANVQGVTADRGPPSVDDPENERQGEPPGPPENPGGCLVGCGGARALLGGLFAGFGTTALLAVGGLALAVLAGLWVLVSGGPTDDGAVPDAAPPPVDAPATEPIAGDLSLSTDVAATNEVYRAWRDLADAVDRSGEGTLTPGEYAAAARRRGYDEAAVETLTDVFRRVRYGRASATGERERRAREAVEAVLDGDAGDRTGVGGAEDRTGVGDGSTDGTSAGGGDGSTEAEAGDDERGTGDR